MYCVFVHGIKMIHYLHQGGAMWSGRFVFLSICLCVQDYFKSNEPILLKLGIMIGRTD